MQSDVGARCAELSCSAFTYFFKERNFDAFGTFSS